MNKIIIGCFLYAAILACAGNGNSKVNSGEIPDGLRIYKKYCVLCHGVDGDLGVSGSKDIGVSLLSKAERISLIKNGKNTMTPFEGVLSPEEIEAVAEYTMTIK